MTNSERKPELLAPAGDRDQMDAAIDAGADAVYFGLETLNARRRAHNFTVHELPELTQRLHRAGVKAVLALNVNLTNRELGQAARILEQARQSAVDSVLVTDPALLLLRDSFPELEFHWSTQAAITNSAGVAAARRFGVDRVVLARELSLTEIQKASAYDDVDTEVFVQGALCFSVSGRCLLSSWGGGRSANRGLCTSPCRVEWTTEKGDRQRYLSMRDICLIKHVEQLKACGVKTLKIEGRLKDPVWTRRAVSAYRAVLDGETPDTVQHLISRLGEYTGRSFTSGYIDERRNNVTGPAAARPPIISSPDAPPDAYTADTASATNQSEKSSYSLSITTETGKLRCVCSTAASEECWELPLPNVKKPGRAVPLHQLESAFRKEHIQGTLLQDFHTDNPDQLIPRRTANAVRERISGLLHRTTTNTDERPQIHLSTAVRQRLQPDPGDPANNLPLGSRTVNRVRVHANALRLFANEKAVESIILTDVSPDDVHRLERLRSGKRLIIALPSVAFEASLVHMRDLVRAAAEQRLPVEVNSWDGLELVKECGNEFETGPGLGILNPLAPQLFKEHNCSCVTLSIEADRIIMEDCSSRCPLPCCIYIFGRPPLAFTRAELSSTLPEETVLHDARDINIRMRRCGDKYVLPSTTAYNLSDISNPRIKARWLAADLVTSPTPYKEWKSLVEKSNDPPVRFNYARTLR